MPPMALVRYSRTTSPTTLDHSEATMAPTFNRRMPVMIARETVATVRSAMWPLARLHRLPPPGDGVGRAPVVLVHGYLAHPDVWRPLIRRLYADGHRDVHTVGYPSTQVGLEDIAAYIHQVVRPIFEQHGPVDLIGHSLGAFASRAYLKAFDGDRYVRRLISLGGPHYGTTFWRLTPPSLWPVLNPRGAWVQRLDDGVEPVPTLVIRARYDQQVFPPVRAALPGVREVVLQDHGHNALLWSRDAHDAVIDGLREPLVTSA